MPKGKKITCIRTGRTVMLLADAEDIRQRPRAVSMQVGAIRTHKLPCPAAPPHDVLCRRPCGSRGSSTSYKAGTRTGPTSCIWGTKDGRFCNGTSAVGSTVRSTTHMYHDDATVDASTYKQQFAMCIMLVNPRRTVGAVANACRRFQHAHHGHSCAHKPIRASKFGVRGAPWRGLTRTYIQGDARIRARTASAPPCHAMSCSMYGAARSMEHGACAIMYHVSCSSMYGEHQQNINSCRSMHANGRHGNYFHLERTPSGSISARTLTLSL
ncbi:hypothetical protein V8C43DRAFT_211969 [Trichoderma afarasin]